MNEQSDNQQAVYDPVKDEMKAETNESAVAENPSQTVETQPATIQETPPAKNPYTREQIAARRQELLQHAEEQGIPLGEAKDPTIQSREFWNMPSPPEKPLKTPQLTRPLTPSEMAQGIPNSPLSPPEMADDATIAKQQEKPNIVSELFGANGSKSGGD